MIIIQQQQQRVWVCLVITMAAAAAAGVGVSGDYYGSGSSSRRVIVGWAVPGVREWLLGVQHQPPGITHLDVVRPDTSIAARVQDHAGFHRLLPAPTGDRPAAWQ